MQFEETDAVNVLERESCCIPSIHRGGRGHIFFLASLTTTMPGFWQEPLGTLL